MTKTKRTERIQEFIDGYAKDWAFKVGLCFRSALDIKQTARVKNGKSRLVWTQGIPPTYAFLMGDMFHHHTDKIILQVIEIKAENKLTVAVFKGTDKDFIECTQAELAAILKTGLSISVSNQKDMFNTYA